MNRETFVTLNRTRLFTADQVVDIAQAEREKLINEVMAILDIRKSFMEELYEELRDPAVAKHSLQQIEIIRHRVEELREGKDGE